MVDFGKYKKKEIPTLESQEIIIPEVSPQEIEKIFVQEEKKPKITLPMISPKRYQKPKFKEKIEITSDNMRTGFKLITGEIPRNTIERIAYDLAIFLNDNKTVKEGRKVFFIKK